MALLHTRGSNVPSLPTPLNSGLFKMNHDTPNYPVRPTWPPLSARHLATFTAILPAAHHVTVLIAPQASGKRAFFETLTHIYFPRRPNVHFISPQAAKMGAHPFVESYRRFPPHTTTLLMFRSYADFLCCDFDWVPACVTYLAPRKLPDDSINVSRNANVLIPYLNELADVAGALPASVRIASSFFAVCRDTFALASVPGWVNAIVWLISYLYAATSVYFTNRRRALGRRHKETDNADV